MVPTKVFVTTLTGKIVPVNVVPSDTIGDVKARVAAQGGIPVSEQLIAFKGQPLDLDSRTLEDCMVPMGSTLFLKPMRFSKPHMIGVRLGDRVIHHPLMPTPDGKGIQLITGDGIEQPIFDWLPELVRFYSSPRFQAPFMLRDDAVGLPSLASPARIHIDEALAELVSKDATPAVVDEKTTEDLMFDTMFANLLEQVMDEVLEADAGSPNTPIMAKLEQQFQPVSALGVDAAVDLAVAAAMRGLPKQLIEETIDKMSPAEMKGGRVAQMQASFGDDVLGGFDAVPEPEIWDQTYQKDFAWYIPDMARDEVTEALTPMNIGDFIVYEQERDDAGSRLPSFVNAPTIQEFVNVPKANQNLGDSDSDSDGMYGENTDAKGAVPAPIIPQPAKKFLPKAKRVQMQARVMRRGEKLGAFTDDAHLDFEVDADTRMVVGRKELVSDKGYGQQMFPGLRNKVQEEQVSKARQKELLEFTDDGATTGFASRPYRVTNRNGTKTKAERDFESEHSVCGHFGPYTHGKIAKQDAAVKLQEAVDNYLPDWNKGIFLVRESSKQGAFVLNVLNGPKVHNYLFKRTDDGFDLMGTHFAMASMDHLIAHFMEAKQDGMSTQLYYYVKQDGACVSLSASSSVECV